MAMLNRPSEDDMGSIIDLLAKELSQMQADASLC
jgi:hypothetical protein